jgi:hypothetical protein
VISYVIAAIATAGLFGLVYDGLRNKDKYEAQHKLRVRKFGK